jgi:hypothetical protein
MERFITSEKSHEYGNIMSGVYTPAKPVTRLGMKS